jgi:starvation-inducible DNA-binding protein
MSSTHNLQERAQTLPITDLLNQLLADTIDFRLSAKQAHWNVRGENFIALHELFDKVSRVADEYADMLAERVAQLDGTALGDLQTVSCRSNLTVYPTDIHTGREHIEALGFFLGLLADACRQAINDAIVAHDMVTADLLTEITRGLDKLHWYIKSHIGN